MHVTPSFFFQENPWKWSFSLQIIFFFRTAALRKLFDIRFSNNHCNFSPVCLLVKMGSKTVTRFIKMKSSSKKGLQIDVGKSKSLVLLLCSAFTRHLGPSSISIFVQYTNEESLEAVFRNSRQNRQNTGARIQSFIVPSKCGHLGFWTFGSIYSFRSFKICKSMLIFFNRLS